MKPLDTFEIEPGVKVYIYAEPDPDWSFIEDQDDLRKIKRGDVSQVIVEVKVYDKSGHVDGSSIIGGVTIGFDDHKQEIRDTIDTYDMIDEARTSLKDKLKEIIEKNT